MYTFISSVTLAQCSQYTWLSVGYLATPRLQTLPLIALQPTMPGIQLRTHKVLVQAVLLLFTIAFVAYSIKPFVSQPEWQRRLPQCIIIGQMKCGTRALLEYLKLHPDMAVANHEIVYFTKFYEKGHEWYRNQMPLSTPGQITVEKSPAYCMSPRTPLRILALNANSKVILVVRDPVDRSVSDWIQTCRVFREVNDTSAGRVCQTYESSGVLTSDGEVNKDISFIRRSSYANFIKLWTDSFAIGSQLLIVDGDNLVSDPLSELKKVEKFLGVRHYLTEENFVFDDERGFYCMVSDRGEKHCLGGGKGVPHPSLRPDVEAKLREYFKPLNKRFYRDVGHNFGWS